MIIDVIWIRIFALLSQVEHVSLATTCHSHNRLSRTPIASMSTLRWMSKQNTLHRDDTKACTILSRYRPLSAVVDVTDANQVMTTLCTLTSLRSLHLGSFCNITSATLSQTTQLTQLTHLRVSACYSKDNIELPTSLRTLSIHALALQHMLKLKNLTSLEVRFVGTLGYRINQTPPTIPLLQSLPLHTLHLPNWSLDNHILPQVEELICKTCTNLVAPKLTKLTIEGMMPSYACLGSLSALRTVRIKFCSGRSTPLSAFLYTDLNALTHITVIKLRIGGRITCKQADIDQLNTINGMTVICHSLFLSN